MYAWKTGQSRQKAPCDFTDQVNCACQYDHQLLQLRLLGLCAQKSKSEKQLKQHKRNLIFLRDHLKFRGKKIEDQFSQNPVFIHTSVSGA